MIKVQSSNLEAVDHDGQHLTVQFKSGATWTYHDVPEPVFRKMLSADSIGGYFAKHVKSSYKAVKHEDDHGRDKYRPGDTVKMH